MDISLLSNRHSLAMVLAVGDRPGQTVRKLTSSPGGNPVGTMRDRLQELVEVGVFRLEDHQIRGWSAPIVYLTDRGTTLYRLLVMVRDL